MGGRLGSGQHVRGYVGSTSLATGFTATHGYQAALLVCAVGSVLGAILGTPAARGSANVVSNAVEGPRAGPCCFGTAGPCF